MGKENEDGPLEEEGGRSQDNDQALVDLNAKWQRRFDEVLKEKRDLESKVTGEDAKTEQREKFLDRKQKAIELALERNLAPSEVVSLLGLDDADDETRIDSLAERDERIRLEERDRFAKKYGTKPVTTARLKTDGGTYEDMLKMSESEISRMPGEEISRRIDHASKGQRSLRSKLRNELGG